MEPGQEIELTVKLNGVDEATEKAARLVEEINEARTLAGELASMLSKLEIEL